MLNLAPALNTASLKLGIALMNLRNIPRYIIHDDGTYEIVDNAIEAVEKFEQQEKRQIDVRIYRKEQFVVINVINPLKESLIYEDGLPVTTKGNKRFHGFGLKSIKYMVKKCGGILNIKEENDCFSLMILIPVPQTT